MTAHSSSSTTVSRNGLVDQLLRGLDRQHATIGDEIVEAVQTGDPIYSTIRDPQLLEDFRVSARRSVRIFARWASNDRTLRDEERDFFRRFGARRANQLMPLDVLFHAFRISQRVLWAAVTRETDSTPDGHEAAFQLVDDMFRFFEETSSVATDAFLQERQRLAAEEDRVHRDLLEDLLAGRLMRRDGTPRHSIELGLHAEDDYRVAVGVPRGRPPRDREGADALRTAVDAVKHHLAGLGHSLVVGRHDEVVALVFAEEGEELLARLERVREALGGHGIDLSVGVSTSHQGLEDTPRAYEEALRALRMAPAQGGLLSLGDVSCFEYLLAHADATAHQIVRPEVHQLLEEDAKHEGVLVETLFAYVDADFNAGRAAETLFVHPNTVHYRLRKISSITAYDRHNVRELIELLVSVRLLLDNGPPPRS